MRRSNQETPQAQSIDMSQWHRDINTFADEMRGELERIIDQLSNAFSPVDQLGFVNPQHDEQQDVSFPHQFEQKSSE